MCPFFADKDGQLRPVAKILATSAFIALVLATVLFTGRHILLGPAVNRQLVEQVHAQLGLDISITAMQGTLFSSLELIDIKTLGGQPKTLVSSIKADRIVFRYSLFSLLSGLAPFLAGTSISLDNADIQLTVSPTPKDPQESGDRPGFFLPATLPRISARNMSVGIDTPGGRIEFNGVTVLSEEKEQEPAASTLAIEARQAILPFPALRQEPFPISMRLRYTPKMVSVEALVVDREMIADQLRLDLSDYRTGRLPFTASLLLCEGGVQLRGVLEEGNVTADLEISKVNLQRPPSFMAKPALSLAGMISGRSAMRVDLADPAGMSGDLSLTFQKGEVAGLAIDQATLAASVADGFLSIRQVVVQLEDSVFSVNDAVFAAAPLLSGDIKDLLSGAEGRFALSAKAIPRLLALAGRPGVLPAKHDKLPLHNLQVAGQLQKGRLTFIGGELKTETAAIVLEQGVITLPPTAKMLDEAMVRTDLVFRFDELKQLTAFFDLPPMTGSLHGRITLDGTLAKLNGTMSLEGEDLAVAGWRLGTVQTRARLIADTVIMESLHIDQGDNQADGSGTFRLADNSIENLQLHLTVNNPDSFAAEVLPGGFPLSGKTVATIKATGPLSEPEITVDARLVDGRYGAVAITDAEVAFIHKGRLLTVRKAHVNAATGEVTLAGTMLRNPDARDFTISLETLQARRGQAEIGLAAPATLSLRGSESLQIDNLILTGNGGSIAASGVLRKSGPADFKIIMTGLTDHGWLEEFTANRLYFTGADAVLQIRGDLQSPALSLTGSIKEIGSRQAPFPFTGAFTLNYEENRLHFDQFAWTGSGGTGTVAVSGSLPFNPFGEKMFPKGALNLAAHFELPALQSISEMLPRQYLIRGSMNGNLVLQGNWDAPIGLVQMTAEDVLLPPTWKFVPPAPFNLACDINLAKDQISFTTLQLSSPLLSFAVTGKWLNPPTVNDIHNRRAGLQTGSLDIAGKLTMNDISWAAKDIAAIRRLDGQIMLEASVTGPATTPTIVGMLQLSNGELRSSYETPLIRALNLAATIDPEQIVISSLHGELGGAPFSAAGRVTRYRDADPQLDVVLQGENLLLYRDAGMKVRSDLDIKIQGPLTRLSIAGDLAITDGRFTRDFDFLSLFRRTGKAARDKTIQLFSFREPPLDKAGLKVLVSTKTPFRIKNNLANGSIRPELLLAGTGELPTIQGNIYLNPIKIKIPAGIITFESGLVHFSETAPDRPQLDLAGKARIMGYEITIQIHGPLDEPTITLSSSPPLPDDELLLLLLTGKISTKTTEHDTAWKGGMNIALYLGRDILSKWFDAADAESDESVLDRFELEIGRGMTRLGEQTIEGQFRLAEGLLQDNDILLITAEKDIYDAYNSGVKIVFRFK